jgi:hypothetical protein
MVGLWHVAELNKQYHLTGSESGAFEPGPLSVSLRNDESRLLEAGIEDILGDVTA